VICSSVAGLYSGIDFGVLDIGLHILEFSGTSVASRTDFSWGQPMTSPRQIIETLANAGILIVCVLIVLLFLSRKEFWLHKASSGSTDEVHFVGKKIADVPGYHWANHPETLVLAIRKGCPYCEASLPFYKQLSGLEHQGKIHAHLLAVMPDGSSTGNEELHGQGIDIDGVFSQPLASIQVLGTPTLLLLDASGKVKNAWVGQLSPVAETEVVAALEK